MNRLEEFLTDYYEGFSSTLFARGSSGLYVAFEALRREKGPGEVIIPGICCETVPLAAVYAGMKPVIADVDTETLCISYEDVLRKISAGTRAIVLAHVFGNLIDPAPFCALQRESDVVLIEDLAQAIGGQDAEEKVGSRFDFTLLSFSFDKIVKGDSGAMVVRNSMYENVFAEIARNLPAPPSKMVLYQKTMSLRNLCHALYDISREDMSIDVSKSFREMIPYYRDLIVRQRETVSEDAIIQQIQNIGDEQKKRNETYQYYANHIHNDVLELLPCDPGAMCWRCCLLLKDARNSVYLTNELRRHNVPASNHYFPLDKLLYNRWACNTRFLHRRIINLWVDSSISREQREEAVSVVNAFKPVT